MRLFRRQKACGDVVTADDGEQFTCQRETGHGWPHKWSRQTSQLRAAMTGRSSSYTVTWWEDESPLYSASTSLHIGYGEGRR